jgi:cytochrome c oxidase subunit 2
LLEAKEPNHFLRIVLWWLVVSVIGTALVVFVAGPGLPPGNGSVEASGQVTDNIVLMALSVPVAAAVLVYLTYALIVFRERNPEVILDGPPIRGNASIQLWWLVITTTLVLFLAGYGSITLLNNGAGGGQGPNPIAAPASANNRPPLQVQVIAQQWEFTYRYPTFGGFETSDLVIPAHTTIAFHVTSLDVIHSFWAYQLEVKADANPDYDNVAYTETTGQLGQFTVRCSELCGLWHGAMYDTGRVVSIPAFMSWATSTEKALAPATKLLPPFAWTYTPDANGADGGYYPDDRDPYSNIETYGAQKTAP